MKHLSIFGFGTLLLILSGCGQKQEDKPQAALTTTPYGSPQEITAYLQTIDPLVQQVNTLHQELYQAVGISGTATGKNLALAMEKGRPRLQQVLAEFEKTTPPPLLVPFHEKIKKLVLLRIEAYGATIKGWQLEQEKDAQFGRLYEQGKQKLAEAQTLGSQLGEERQSIQQALVQTSTPPPQAASR